MKDPNLVYVDDEVRRLMREFGDLIFDEADQEVVDGGCPPQQVSIAGWYQTACLTESSLPIN